MKRINFILFLFTYSATLTLSAQNETFKKDTSLQNSPDYVWKPYIAPFVELGGKGWLSMNVDFRIKETCAISFGAAGIEEGVSPNIMGYYFGGKRHRLETGGGISGIIEKGNFISLMVHGVIGYRFQKKKGLLFRVGFTPMLEIPLTNEGSYAVIPWVGLSMGYSF